MELTGEFAGDGVLALWPLESGAARVQQDMEPDQPHKIGGWVTVPWPEIDFS